MKNQKSKYLLSSLLQEVGDVHHLLPFVTDMRRGKERREGARGGERDQGGTGEVGQRVEKNPEGVCPVCDIRMRQDLLYIHAASCMGSLLDSKKKFAQSNKLGDKKPSSEVSGGGESPSGEAWQSPTGDAVQSSAEEACQSPARLEVVLSWAKSEFRI